MKMGKRILLGSILLLFCHMMIAASLVTQVVKLHYRHAQDLLPLLRPFVIQGGLIEGQGYELVMKTTAENYHQLRQLIHQLDTPPRSLKISVRQVNDADYDTVVSSSGKQRVLGTTTGHYHDSEQSIRVEDGQSAFISIGQRIPTDQFRYGPFGTGSDNVLYLYPGNGGGEYHDIDSGFSVQPRLVGKEVALTIHWQQQDLVNRAPGYRSISAITQQHSNTTLRIPVGKWVAISQTSTRQLRTDDRKVYRTDDLQRPDTHIMLKVEVL